MTKEKCICQICICGRHRCPHNRKTHLGKQAASQRYCPLNSEYQSAFERHPYQTPQGSLKPRVTEQGPRLAMTMNTTYDTTYMPHKDVPHVLVKKNCKYVPPNKEVDKDTTYTMDYTAKAGERTMPFRPSQAYNPRGTKFNTKTVHHATYRDFKPAERESCRPEAVRPKESPFLDKTKFDTISTVMDDYKEHKNIERPKPFIPQDNPQLRDEAFQGCTSYKFNYTGKQNPTPMQIAKGRDRYKPMTAPFMGVTTVQADYQPHPGNQRQKPFRPPRNDSPTNTPFTGQTTMAENFKEWPVEQRQTPPWGKIKDFVQPTTPFSKTSSYQDAFYEPSTEFYDRVKPALPDSSKALNLSHNAVPRSKIDGTTQYMLNYIPWQGSSPPKPHLPVSHGFVPSKDKFDSKSQYKSHYQGEQTCPAEICRPLMRISDHAEKPMVCDTTYKDDFTGDRPSSCPASSLVKEGGEKGRFVAAGERKGHRFFIEKEREGVKAEAPIVAPAPAVAPPVPVSKEIMVES